MELSCGRRASDSFRFVRCRAPQIILVGRVALIGLIYGATYESIAHTLKYDIVNVTILIIVVLTEFLAYSIATHGGVRIGESVGKLDNGTRQQRIVNSLVGPLPFTYSKVKHEIKREMRSAVKLLPIIAVILLFSAMLGNMACNRLMLKPFLIRPIRNR